MKNPLLCWNDFPPRREIYYARQISLIIIEEDVDVDVDVGTATPSHEVELVPALYIRSAQPALKAITCSPSSAVNYVALHPPLHLCILPLHP